MKIVDGFIFYNELKMLLFKLVELYDVVDYFVIVEATHTFNGEEKELFYEKNKHIYKRFSDKIIHIIVDDMPNNGNAWDNEHHQRNCIDRGISKLNLDDDDLVIISDCDEIPDSNTLSNIKNSLINIRNITCLEMEFYYYNITSRCPSNWYHTKIAPYSEYRKTCQPEYIRHNSTSCLRRCGWHLSYFGDVNFIKNKIKHFSHQEYNNDQYLDDDKIQQQIESHGDLFFRDGHDLMHIDVKDNPYLPNNYGILYL